MSTGTPTDREDALQFDQADYSSDKQDDGFAASGAVCGGCQEPLADTYYEVNGQVLCELCKRRLEEALIGGSAGGRFVRAALFGIVTAAVGSGLYWGIRAGSGYSLSIVAIALGWLIGGAIMRGTYGRGGLIYQFAAVVLTYAAISFSYLPDLILSFINEAKEVPANVATVEAARTGEKPAATAPATASVPDVASKTVAGAEGTQLEKASSEPDALPSFGALVTVLAIMVRYTLSVPVMIGMESPIAFLIYGFGLLQAWQMTRKLQVAISGPFSLDTRPPVPPVAAVAS